MAKLSKLKDKLDAGAEKRASQGNSVVCFDNLGVDTLHVDESHEFKNLGVNSKLSVAGVSQAASGRAMDLFLKSEYLREHHGESKGLYFYSGTPVTNSIAETYTIGRFLQPDVWEDFNLHAFDDWVGTFGRITSSLEMLPEGGGYRIRDRLSQFVNLGELRSAFLSYTDVLTKNMLMFPLPKVEHHHVNQPRSDLLERYMNELTQRAMRVRRNNVDPSEDNLLKISTEGRLAAIDMRLINPDIPGSLAGSRIEECADNVQQVWLSGREKKTTQIVFCDSGTPKSVAEQIKKPRFDLYRTLKKLLIDRGIPEKEIAFSQDAKTDLQRERLKSQVRSGDKRVVIASVAQFGVGVDVQDLVAAIHELDVPWRPDIVEQRRARGIRFGNKNDEIKLYTYVTEDSFDVSMWALNSVKASFIEQLFENSEKAGREINMDAEFSFAETVAITTGNTLFKDKVLADEKLKLLVREKMQWTSQVVSLEKRFHQTEKDIVSVSKEVKQLVGLSEDMDKLKLGERGMWMIEGVTDKQDGNTSWLPGNLEGLKARLYQHLEQGSRVSHELIGAYSGQKVTAQKGSSVVFVGDRGLAITLLVPSAGRLNNKLIALTASVDEFINEKIQGIQDMQRFINSYTPKENGFPKENELVEAVDLHPKVTHFTP